MPILLRALRPGDHLSLENGRVVIFLEDKTGRKARLRLHVAEGVIVDKPRISANEERAKGKAIENP